MKIKMTGFFLFFFFFVRDFYHGILPQKVSRVKTFGHNYRLIVISLIYTLSRVASYVTFDKKKTLLNLIVLPLNPLSVHCCGYTIIKV